MAGAAAGSERPDAARHDFRNPRAPKFRGAASRLGSRHSRSSSCPGPKHGLAASTAAARFDPLPTPMAPAATGRGAASLHRNSGPSSAARPTLSCGSAPSRTCIAITARIITAIRKQAPSSARPMRRQQEIMLQRTKRVRDARTAALTAGFSFIPMSALSAVESLHVGYGHGVQSWDPIGKDE